MQSLTHYQLKDIISSKMLLAIHDLNVLENKCKTVEHIIKTVKNFNSAKIYIYQEECFENDCELLGLECKTVQNRLKPKMRLNRPIIKYWVKKYKIRKELYAPDYTDGRKRK